MNNKLRPWKQEAIEAFSDLIARIDDIDDTAQIIFIKTAKMWDVELRIEKEGDIRECKE